MRVKFWEGDKLPDGQRSSGDPGMKTFSYCDTVAFAHKESYYHRRSAGAGNTCSPSLPVTHHVKLHSHPVINN